MRLNELVGCYSFVKGYESDVPAGYGCTVMVSATMKLREFVQIVGGRQMYQA